MTPRLRLAAHHAVRAVIGLGAGIVAIYTGAIVLFAVLFARIGSMWEKIYVYEYGDTDLWDSRSELIDIYARPPLGIWGWLALSAIVFVGWAIVVWGLWLIAWAIVGILGIGGSANSWLRPGRIAAPAILWGIAILSAYALAIFLWDWIEWKHELDVGLNLVGDPKPGPDPAFDPTQIPLGIVAFGAIAALAVVARTTLRRRGGPSVADS
ncbi:MAG: hypothetical protein JW722_00725 [Demequinaceae bacterium]|nr:hypothetical protein [Demequinaceae bacterium]